MVNVERFGFGEYWQISLDAGHLVRLPDVEYSPRGKIVKNNSHRNTSQTFNSVFVDSEK